MNTEVVYNTEAMQHFNYAHLPTHIQDISRPFAELAYDMMRVLPNDEQRHFMLQKLLEAKDCAVRSHLSKGFTDDV